MIHLLLVQQQTPDICLGAILQNPEQIRYVQNPTQEMVRIALQKNPNLKQYIRQTKLQRMFQTASSKKNIRHIVLDSQDDVDPISYEPIQSGDYVYILNHQANHCFSEETMKTLVMHNTKLHPMTREEIRTIERVYVD